MTAVQFHDPFGDRQAQPRACVAYGSSDLAAKKSLQDSGLLLRWNTAAGVRNRDNGARPLLLYDQFDVATRGCAVNGVIEQVLQNALEQADIRENVNQRDGARAHPKSVASLRWHYKNLTRCRSGA